MAKNLFPIDSQHIVNGVLVKFGLFKMSLAGLVLLSLTSVSNAGSTPTNEGRNTWSIDAAVSPVEVSNICPNIAPLKFELSQDKSTCNAPIVCIAGTLSEDGKNCIQPSAVKKVCPEGSVLFAGVCGTCPAGQTAREAFRRFACINSAKNPSFPTNTTQPSDEIYCANDAKLSEDKKTCSTPLVCPPKTTASADGKTCSTASVINKACPPGAQLKGEECLSCKTGWTHRMNPDRSVKDCTTSGATCAANQGVINPNYPDICDVRLPIQWFPKLALRPGMPLSYLTSDKISGVQSNVCNAKMTDGKSYPGTHLGPFCYVPFEGAEVKKEFPSADTFIAALPHVNRSTWVAAKGGALPNKPGVVKNGSAPDVIICRAIPEGDTANHVGYLVDKKCLVGFAGKAQSIEKFEFLSGI